MFFLEEGIAACSVEHVFFRKSSVFALDVHKYKVMLQTSVLKIPAAVSIQNTVGKLYQIWLVASKTERKSSFLPLTCLCQISTHSPMAPTHSTGTVQGWSCEWGLGLDAAVPPCVIPLVCTLRNVQHVHRGLGMALGSSRRIGGEMVSPDAWSLAPDSWPNCVLPYSHSSLYQN